MQSQLTKSFSSAANTAAQYPQYSKQIIAAAQTSFLDGADWAYVAGLDRDRPRRGARVLHVPEARRASSSCSPGTTRKTLTTTPSTRDLDPRHRRAGAATARPTSRCSLSARSSRVLVGFWAQTQSTVNVNLFRTLNDLSGNMVGLAKGVYALGSIWAVLAVARRAAGAAPVPRRGVCRARGCRRVGPVAPAQRAARYPRHQRTRSQRPHRRRAGVPGSQRRRDHRARLRASRRSSCARCGASSSSSSSWSARPRCTSAPGFPADVIGGLLVGFGVAALVRVVFGAPGGQPSVAEVRAALADLGYDVVTIAPAAETHPARRGDGRRARHRRAPPGRRVRPRPARRPHRRRRCGTRRCTTTPACPCSAAASSRSSTSASR